MWADKLHEELVPDCEETNSPSSQGGRADPGSDYSDSDGGFYAQASAGLIYNINSQFELYAGGRWRHLNSLEFGDIPLELDDSFAWEVGARVNF
jgi:hypothetical protein